MNLYNKVFIIFSWCYFVTKRYWMTFVWYCCICVISDTVLFNIFLSQAHWISEKANIIAVMDKNSRVYLMLNVHLFFASKVEFLEKRGLKQKIHKRNRNRKGHVSESLPKSWLFVISKSAEIFKKCVPEQMMGRKWSYLTISHCENGYKPFFSP